MTNNALPLYLCRPFTRAEYVLGKMSVLLILLSLITWVPILLVFLFQSYLAGWSWFAQNLRIAGAIFVGSWVWILLLALLSLAISSLGQVADCRERRADRGLLHSSGVCRSHQ